MEWEKSVVTGSNPWTQEKRFWCRNFKYQPAGRRGCFQPSSLLSHLAGYQNAALLTHVLKLFLLSSSTEWMRNGTVGSEFLKCAGNMVILGIYCMPHVTKNLVSPSPYYVMSFTFSPEAPSLLSQYCPFIRKPLTPGLTWPQGKTFPAFSSILL